MVIQSLKDYKTAIRSLRDYKTVILMATLKDSPMEILKMMGSKKDSQKDSLRVKQKMKD